MKVGDHVQVVPNLIDEVSLDYAGKRGYITKVWTQDWPYEERGPANKVMVDFEPDNPRATMHIFYAASVREITTLDLIAEV